MGRRDHDIRFSSPAVERARARAEERNRALHGGATGRVVGDRVDLEVLVDEIAASPLEVKETLPRSWVKALLDDKQEIHWDADGDAEVDVTLSVESAFVRMKGKARFRLLHPCVRCGQRDVTFDLPLKIDLRLVERAKDVEIDADFEAHSDGDDHAGSMLGDAADLEDLDIASYQGDAVDVGSVLREQLFLELPAHPNCESPGSTLGEPCGFAEQQRKLAEERANAVDPRWGPLLGLKAQLPLATPPPKSKGPSAPKPARQAEPLPPKAAATSDQPPPVAPTPAPTPAAPAPQPAAEKSAPKPAAKNAKESAAKKTEAKKPAKTTAAKKPAKTTAAKKPAKKTAAKQPAKTTAAKKPAQKTAKKPAQKTAAKKPAKKTAAKKPVKKPAAKKPAKKPAQRA